MYIQKYIQKIHKISSCSVRLYKLFQMFPIIANNYATLASLSPPLALKQTIHSNSFHHCFYKFNNQALDLPHFKIFKNSAVRVKLLKNIKCAPLLECAAISLNKTNLEKFLPWALMVWRINMSFHHDLSCPLYLSLTHYLAYCMRQMKVCWAAQFCSSFLIYYVKYLSDIWIKWDYQQYNLVLMKKEMIKTCLL